ncbi:MAG: Asp-tRNA(Asn)/Glu-tRNA(Gln) amidotransferase subunit GatC, partial [Fidelibacterota bacterium]
VCMSKDGKVSTEEVLRIATLAKLQLTEEEVEKYTSQLNDILEYMEQLKELDTENIEPLSHVLDLKNVARKDTEESSLSREEALSNAPESDGQFFIVPKVIDKS